MSNVWKLHKHYQYHVQFHVQDFLQKCVTTVHYVTNFSYFSFNTVTKFLSSLSMYVFISIKTTSPHRGNLRAERIGNSGTQFFLCKPCWDFWCNACTTVKKHGPRNSFSRNHAPNRVLSCLQNMPIYFPCGKYFSFQFVRF